jgi:hypothetical protein
MHDGICFDKILPKQVGYFGARTLENSDFGHNARSIMSQFSLAGSSLTCLFLTFPKPLKIKLLDLISVKQQMLFYIRFSFPLMLISIPEAT